MNWPGRERRIGRRLASGDQYHRSDKRPKPNGHGLPPDSRFFLMTRRLL
jgi:hypothetical protein